TLRSDELAEGKWTLAFRQVNLIDNTETVRSIEYVDEYVVENGEWKMSKCQSITLWSMTRPLADGTVVTEG
ncbi:nuclear transport factor 2 family protein, partial [Rhodococcus hoagii]|nr:nuclear transport factor 2 family protein [Prescottella equi]